MNTRTYKISGIYRDNPGSTVTFTVDALSATMARHFVAGFMPTFAIRHLKQVDFRNEHHFCFADVNPVISSQFHLGQRRLKRTRNCSRPQVTA